MAAEQQPERLRLVVEPDPDDGARGHPTPIISRLAPEFDTDDPDEADTPEEPDEHRRRLLPVAFAAVGAIAFVAVVWYAYKWGVGAIGPEELPLIKAETGPIKVRPDAPGGLEIPHQDKLVLNEITPDPARPQVERLLPPPEVPIPPKPAEPASAELDLSPAAGPAAEDAAEPPVSSAPSDSEQPAIAKAEQPPAAAPQATAPKAPAPKVAAPKVEAPAAKTAAPKAAAPKVAAAPPAPAAKLPPAAPTRAQTAAAPAGGDVFRVQLASMKSKDRVRTEFDRLRAAFPQILAGTKMTVESVEVSGRGTFHRLQVGAFGDRPSADALCSRLKAKGQDCLVVRR